MSIVENALKRAKSAPAWGHEAGARLEQGEMQGAGRQGAGLQGLGRDFPRVDFDPEQMRASGLVAEPAQERRQTQEFSGIKRALLTSLGGAHTPKSLIAVASALSGEGKTYVSFNLAKSLAGEVDRSVLLIDADLPKQDLTRLLGLAGRRGLADYLRDQDLGLADVVVSTSIPHLYFMPAGEKREDSAELLASVRMRELADMLVAAESGAFTVLDSSPILLAPDAQSILAIAGSIVIVIRSLVSRKAEVMEAVRRIDASKNVLGVLNAWKPLGPFALQGGYGNYGD